MAKLEDYRAMVHLVPAGSKKQIAALIVLQACIPCFMLLRSASERQILQAVTESRYEHIAGLFSIFVLAFMLPVLTGYWAKILTAQLVQRNAEYLKLNIFGTALRLPPTAAAEKNDALSAIAFDAEELARFVPVNLIGLFVTFGTFAAYTAFCVYLSPILAAATLVLIIPSLLIEKYFIPKIAAQYKKFSESESILRTRLQEMIRTVDIIKVFSVEEHVIGHCAKADEQRYCNKLKHTLLTVLSSIGSNAASYIAIFGGFAVSSTLYAYHYISLPDVIVALMVVEGGMVWPASNFLQEFSTIASNKASFERIKPFLAVHNRQERDTPYTIEQGGTLTVSLDNLSFAYPTPTDPSDKTDKTKEAQRTEAAAKPVLNNIQLRIPHRARICIVGESGAGKTTLMNILLGFLEPQTGSVQFYYNGEQYSGDRRNLIAYIPQTGALFLDTIAENIRFGDPSAERSQLIQAAEQAGAHSFIMESVQGYDTVVGGKEDKLSGGQAQRIAIARALLKKSPLLIMDEPSSALDSASEAYIIAAIRQYEGTVIFISHRQSLIQAADTVYRLENGTLCIESGSPYAENQSRCVKPEGVQ
ncbi:MAG: ABC transporter ATP-binding protein [Treponema sp.]